jgi:hypothetical protein
MDAMLTFMESHFLYVLLGFIPLIMVAWYVTIRFDKARIRSYMEERSHVTLWTKWRPFGHGWLAESHRDGGGNRIYRVCYRDVYGNIHEAWVKTAFFGGVYMSQDEIVEQAMVQDRPMTDAEKVAILEMELARARSASIKH